ncbi:McrB family protein [Salinivibrio proteolyticus]|uniref:McrB family protein n=1 Tax=Salinivibrio proteolyticus TaxID=334715 RepID=UPI000988AA33|nr:AAA family ATPase [Salinivibrio proteolyticus]OOF28473.1 hypothetical protein BZJ20_15960 [Salinivibrio proteolyticus]
MLKDLNQLIKDCRDHFDSLEHTGDIHIDARLATLLKQEFEAIEKSKCHIFPFSISLISEDGLRADLPSSLLWYAHAFWPLDEALVAYQQKRDSLRKHLVGKGFSYAEVKAFLKALPSQDLDYSSPIGKEIKAFIDAMNPSDASNFHKLLTDRAWWVQPHKKSEQTTGKTLERSDVFQSALTLAARLIVNNASKLQSVVRTFTQSQTIREYFEQLSKEPIRYQDQSSLSTAKATPHLAIAAKNEIIYGAPGTGKSHKIAEKTAGQKKVVTVFHPDTQHSDFVGALKPTMSGGAVTYQFRPGPFTTALIEALTHADEHVYLIIEEINRAPAAAVFGELFQLLDRENGASKYDIDATDPDMLSYINQKLADKGIAPITKLALPNNLSLLATMNSSDQAVMPLDTAFKRRWSFEYVKIDFSNPDVSQQTFKLSTSDGEKIITWKNFANHVVNRRLQEISVPEDRLLGPFFLNKEELDSDESAQQSLCGKLFVYLWDDVLRHKGRTNVFREGITTFGDLQARFNQGDSPVFNETVDQLIIEHSEAAPAVIDVDEEDSDNNE